MRFHHHREDEAVEHDVVLADEVDEACVVLLPPLLPCTPLLWLFLAELLGVLYVADRRIEPYIEHLAFGAFYRYRYAPVEVACHGAWLKVHVKP